MAITGLFGTPRDYWGLRGRIGVPRILEAFGSSLSLQMRYSGRLKQVQKAVSRSIEGFRAPLKWFGVDGRQVKH